MLDAIGNSVMGRSQAVGDGRRSKEIPFDVDPPMGIIVSLLQKRRVGFQPSDCGVFHARSKLRMPSNRRSIVPQAERNSRVPDQGETFTMSPPACRAGCYPPPWKGLTSPLGAARGALGVRSPSRPAAPAMSSRYADGRRDRTLRMEDLRSCQGPFRNEVLRRCCRRPNR